MKLWSRGLGKQEIHMDFRYCKAIKDPETGNMLIIGTMQSPVTWEFKITFHPEDIGGILKAIFTRSMFIFAIKNLPQYLFYLKDRDKYKLEGNIVEKVNAAYEQCMTGGRAPYYEPVSVSSRVSSRASGLKEV
jgi:hypothetical protein